MNQKIINENIENKSNNNIIREEKDKDKDIDIQEINSFINRNRKRYRCC